jgi:anaerobic ribonucleoside-triphosphate reductase
MKKFVRKINCCYYCDYRMTTNCRDNFCIACNRKNIEVNIFKEIPDWCPLEDLEDDTD